MNKKLGIKPIRLHTTEELDAAINLAKESFPLFWIVLHGVDAYMERRRRRKEAAEDRRAEIVRQEYYSAMDEDNGWGD